MTTPPEILDILHGVRHATVALIVDTASSPPRLVTAAVHLLPPGQVRAPSLPTRFLTDDHPDQKKFRLAWRVAAMSADDALAWYVNLLQGSPTLPTPSDPAERAKQDGTPLSCAALAAEPPWPSLQLTGPDLGTLPPGQPIWAQSLHVNALYPVDPPDRTLVALVDDPERRDWIYRGTGVRLARDNACGWLALGGAVLVIPDPLIRRSRLTLHQAPTGSQIDIALDTWPGSAPQTLSLTVIERRLGGGIGFIHTAPLPAPGQTRLALPHDPQMVELIVSQGTRARVLQPPAPFLRQAIVLTSIATRQSQIIDPAGNTVTEVTDHHDETMQVGHGRSGSTPRVVQSHADARRINAGTAAGQYWFDPTIDGTVNADKRSNERSLAIGIIKDLIINARKRVLIIDPYGADGEIFEFALHVRHDQINIGLLTTKSAFTDQQKIAATDAALATARQIRPNMALRVGSPAALHDRFILIDDQVWRCGTSLNSIGTTIGGLDRAQDPQPYQTTLEKIWNASPTWECWLRERTP